ncbi:MAG: HEPN domain-containing protein [Bacteroidales bacterium]|nr:HEPN domain-containing protein [Bacteroidales bacterium]
MNKTKEEYITYRLERAILTLNDAKTLANTKSWNSSINRLYYACFYAILALFAKNDINSNTHTGVKTQFNLHFIKNGKLDKSFGMLFSDLFDYRQKGDYGDLFDFEETDVVMLIPQVEDFIKKIEELSKH